MVRVYGQLFEDGRDGVLVIKPSKPFFGADRDERHYDVVNGRIEIDLSPTPTGIYYNVGFQRHGDLRDPVYTLKWRIPNNVSEIDIAPKPRSSESQPSTAPYSEMGSTLHAKRLASELADEISNRKKLESQLDKALTEREELSSKVRRLELATEASLAVRDAELSRLREAQVPATQTVYVSVPVPPEPLQERIQFLEAEVKRLMELNDTYYASVLELNQLKLERAQTVHLPQNVEEIPDTPRQRLIQKLTAR